MIWLQVYTLTIHTYLTTQSDSSIPDICNKMMLKLIVLPCVMLSVLGNYIESRMGKKLKYRPQITNPLLSNSRVPFMEKRQERNHREQVGTTDSRSALISSNS